MPSRDRTCFNGDVEQTIPWFERAIDNRHPLVNIYALHPRLERLRADPQYARVLQAAGLQRFGDSGRHAR